MTQDLTALLVQNTKTGEITPVTLTRVGMYKLVKIIADQEDLDCAAVVNSFGQIDEIYSMMPRDYYDVMRDVGRVFGRNRDFTSISAKILNVIFAVDGKYHFKDDVFKLENRYFPKQWKIFVTRCQECDERFFDQNVILTHRRYIRLEQIPTQLLGIDGLCRECALDADEYRVCECCGRFLDPDTDEYDIVDDETVCEYCLENSGNYRRCDNCGDWFNVDNDYAQFLDDGDYAYCCDECAESDGWHWNSYYNEWRRGDDDCCEIDEVIPDYHSHGYYPIGEIKRKNQKHDLYIGRETETDGNNRYDYEVDYFEGLLSLFKDTCFFEQDGSLDEGFEIITQPMTEEEFFKTDWETPFKKLRDDGWKSHDTYTCGTHFHYSKWYLGYTAKQQRDSAKKVCRFFQLYADDIEKIARRGFGHYCVDLRSFNETITSKTSFSKLGNDRYWAVNLTNLHKNDKGTIEIRVCRGTLVTNTMLASADFFLHIVRNAKSIPWKDIGNLKLWFKGIKKKVTIDYIKSKNAFNGAF